MTQCLVSHCHRSQRESRYRNLYRTGGQRISQWKQIEICKQANITTIVAQPEQGKSNENGTTKDYLVAQFQYNQDTDTYTCPQGETLKPGSWHKKTTDRDSYNFKNTEPQNAKHVRKTFMYQ
jgi:hypothetical protein